MAKVAILGLVGEEGLYIVDLEAGTVAPMTVPVKGALQAVVDLQKAGGSVMKGVSVAISVKSAEDISNGRFDG
ncbi:hypothetical protein AC244_06090 [Ensifer adhaerens]|uniref:Uncharacterized protein n=1 Tax=Ensifer adhaerens TaxID=106592 RepID=A0A0L8C2F3_ENSAD|nr:hypothetical protein [Ensifer adhaerens]KOF20974.1 hypothetical protein AC244_06090 [Ensifer adhaerens]